MPQNPFSDGLSVQVDSDISGLESGMDSAIDKITSLKGAVGVLGGALAGLAAGGIAKSVSAAADFDAAMTESLAIMDDVSSAMREDMAGAAREVARETQFSANQAAESYFFLASAGMDAQESMASIGDVAQFAQAGMFDMETATDLLTDSASALGIEMDNLSQLGDKFVKANTLANTSVEQIAQAMTNKAAPAMKRLGVETNEGIAALSVFADQGLKGQRAGTIFARTLDGLANKARENTGAFQDLGVQVFDSEGNMRSMQAIVGDLEKGLAGMSTEQKQAALAQLGLNRRAAQGIDLLIGNSEQLGNYRDELADAGGTAQEVAQKQLDTLNQQLGLAKDALVDIGISIGNVFLPALTSLTKHVVSALQAFADWNAKMDGLPGAIGLVTTGIVGLTAALAAFVGGPLVALPGLVAAVATAFKTDFAGIQTTATNVLNTLKTEFKATAQLLKTVFGPAIETAGTAFGRLRQRVEAAIAPIVTAVGEDLVGGIQRAGQTIRTELQMWATIWQLNGERVVRRTELIWGQVEMTVGQGLDAVRALLQGNVGLFESYVREAMAMAKGTLITAWNSLPDVIHQGIETVRQTLATLPQRAKQALSGLKQLLPQPFQDALGEVERIVTDTLGRLTGLWNTHKQTVLNAINPILQPIEKLAKKLGFLSDQGQPTSKAMTSVGLAIAGLSNPITMAVGLITNLATVWQKNIFGIRDTTQQALTQVRTIWTTQIQPLVEDARRIFGQVLTVVQTTLNRLWKNVVKPILGSIRQQWQIHGQEILQELVETYTALRERLRALLNALLPIVKVVVGAILVVWNEFGDEITAVTQFVFDLVGSIINTALDAILTAIQITLNLIQGDWEEAWNALAGFTERLFNGILNFVEKWATGFLGAIVTLLSDAYQAFVDWASDLFYGSLIPDLLSDIKTAFEDFGGNVLSWLGNFIGTFIEDVTTFASDLIHGENSIINRLVGGIEDAFDDMKKAIVGKNGIIAKLASEAKSMFEDLGGALASKFKGAFNQAVPSSVDIPSVTVNNPLGEDVTIGGGSLGLPQLASGGFIEEGGLAMLHPGEQVVPAAQVDRSGGSGPTTIDASMTVESGAVQVDGADGSAEDIGQAIEERLAEFETRHQRKIERSLRSAAPGTKFS